MQESESDRTKPAALTENDNKDPIKCSRDLTESLATRVEMNAIYGFVPLQHLIGVLAPLWTRFNVSYDQARSALFFYVLVEYGIKSLRHIRARGNPRNEVRHLQSFRPSWPK